MTVCAQHEAGRDLPNTGGSIATPQEPPRHVKQLRYAIELGRVTDCEG